MNRADMTAAMGGIMTRPKAATKGAITGIPKKEEKDTKKRRVISIAETDYRKLKMYAASEGITITEVVSRIVESSTIL